MIATADRKYAEATATEIAALIPGATVHDDADLGSYIVRIKVGRKTYELAPAAGRAIWAVLRNGSWVVGIETGGNVNIERIAREFAWIAR